MAAEPSTTAATDTELTSGPPSRRGRTLGVAKLVIIFADGTREQWDFPEGTNCFYREGGNRQTKPTRSWKTHELWWKSDEMVEGK